MLNYKILDNNDFDEIDDLDKIRIKAFGQTEGTDYFVNQIKDNKMHAVEVLLDQTVIGGCYVYISPNTHSLNIDRIFILDEYRHHQYASQLLEYVLSHKREFEDIYQMKVTTSIVEPSSDELIKFYKLNGYRGPNVIGGMTKALEYEDTDSKHK